MAVAGGNGSFERRVGSDPAVRPHDGAVDDGPFLDVGLPADDGVGQDPRALLDHGSLVDEARADHLGARFDARVRRYPGRAGAVERRSGVAAVHDVVMDVHVLARGPDVDRVAVVDVRDERFTALDERRKEAPLDRPRGVLRDPVERVGLEDVDAGVNRVARDLVVSRLLEEPPDVAVAVCLDQAVGSRVVDGREHDRGLRLALAVQPQHGREIHLRQYVAIEDDHRFGERVPRIADRPARADRHRFDDVADADAESFTFAENLLYAARLVIEAENHLVDLRDLLEEIDLVIQKLPGQDRNDRLWRVDRQWSQPRTFASGEQDGFHDNLQFYAFDRIAPR